MSDSSRAIEYVTQACLEFKKWIEAEFADPAGQIDLSTATPAWCRKMIGVYAALFSGHFQSWLGLAGARCKSTEAKRAVAENIDCEFEHDHAGMLINLAEMCDAMPDQDSFGDAAAFATPIRAVMKDLQNAGLTTVVILAVLETASQSFIPVVRAAATRLGCTDLKYCDVHGEADAEHAKAFQLAVAAEIDAGYGQWGGSRVMTTSRTVITMLQFVFSRMP